MEESPCLRIPRRLGSQALSASKGLKLLNDQLVVKRESNYVVIPLSRKPTSKEASLLRMQLQEVDLTTSRFSRKPKQIKSVREALKGRIPSTLLAKLPHSMDIIGQIAIVEVPSELEKYKHLIGEAVLTVNKNVRTALAKSGAVGGKLRLRAYDQIAGAGETKTVHREHRCSYALDPTQVYFSPRLSQEHLRVAQKVRSGEVVVDMFAGVGPFSILIAKKHSNNKIYAIDVNPAAIKFLNQNIAANKVDNIFAILGDAKAVIESNLIGKADRVIMNLPDSAKQFIDVACKALKPCGGIIHYYGFETEPDASEKAEKNLDTEVSKAGRIVKRVLGSRLVRSTAPHEWQIAIEIQVA